MAYYCCPIVHLDLVLQFIAKMLMIILSIDDISKWVTCLSNQFATALSRNAGELYHFVNGCNDKPVLSLLDVMESLVQHQAMRTTMKKMTFTMGKQIVCMHTYHIAMYVCYVYFSRVCICVVECVYVQFLVLFSGCS